MIPSIRYFLIAITSIFIVSCKNIPSDPIKGADKYISEMEELASKQDYPKAEKLTGEYLTKYSKQELTTFLGAVANFRG